MVVPVAVASVSLVMEEKERERSHLAYEKRRCASGLLQCDRSFPSLPVAKKWLALATRQISSHLILRAVVSPLYKAVRDTANACGRRSSERPATGVSTAAK